MIKINSQQDLDVLLALPDWEDAFLREWYLLSPEHINPLSRRTAAPDSAPAMLMLICTPEPSCPGIELFFEEVEEIRFSCRCDLDPVARFHKHYISFSFQGGESPSIMSKSLYYRILEKDSWGRQLRYGTKNLFDESGFLDSEILES